jgi:hypothetical protein
MRGGGTSNKNFSHTYRSRRASFLIYEMLKMKGKKFFYLNRGRERLISFKTYSQGFNTLLPRTMIKSSRKIGPASAVLSYCGAQTYFRENTHKSREKTNVAPLPRVVMKREKFHNNILITGAILFNAALQKKNPNINFRNRLKSRN